MASSRSHSLPGQAVEDSENSSKFPSLPYCNSDTNAFRLLPSEIDTGSLPFSPANSHNPLLSFGIKKDMMEQKMKIPVQTPPSEGTKSDPVQALPTQSRKQSATASVRRNSSLPAKHPSITLMDENALGDVSATKGSEMSDTQEQGSVEELIFTVPEVTPDGASTGRLVKEKWPIDHIKLLYMLSQYAVCARSGNEKETWIRQLPLLVLMYEGIAAGELNFDYAPAALVAAQEGTPKRIWINTTQDGKSAIDDMREANLINGLKLSTKNYHSVTAFQVSLKGLILLKSTSKELRASVDSFIFAPKPYRHELLKIRYIPIKDKPGADTLVSDGNQSSIPTWLSPRRSEGFHVDTVNNMEAPEEEEAEFNEEGRFILESIGYFRYSEVTETEDVSYVSSPFIPCCVRSETSTQSLTSNAHRADEAAGGESTIRDTLSEAIVLSNPVCLVGEWIPFGSNQIVALNERLGSMDRCQGGLFTSLIDDRPTDTLFEVPPGLTEVRILDYNPVRFINFEAEINFPEDDGIVQVENFGIHINVDGTIFYGISVDSILHQRADHVSVDLLSRLLVDIHQDSSEVMDDLLSSYQTGLLDMAFLGDITNRGKFNLICADHIEPFLSGGDYMDRGDLENELKQVIGDIHCSYDIGDESVMIVGRDGMLVAGSAGKRYENIFVAYFSLLCREMFLRSFFNRIFVLEELLKSIRDLILKAREDPSHLSSVRTLLNQATNDLVLFTDTLGYLLESLEYVKIPQQSENASSEEISIFDYLDLTKQHRDIFLRAKDLEKLVHASKYEVVNLRQMAEVLNTSQLEDIFHSVEVNTKALADSELDIQKSTMSLDVVQYLVAGSFALALVDRFPGSTLNVGVPSWVKDFAASVIEVPMLFFTINMIWMLLFILILYVYKKHEASMDAFGKRLFKIQLNYPIDIPAFESFLLSRSLEKQDSVSQLAYEIRSVSWRDNCGTPCKGEAAHLDRRGVRGRREPQTIRQKFRHRIATFKSTFSGELPRTRSAVSSVVKGKINDMDNGDFAGSLRSMTNSPTSNDLPVFIEIEYDSRYGFLLAASFHFRCFDDCGTAPLSSISWSPSSLRARFKEWLATDNVDDKMKSGRVASTNCKWREEKLPIDATAKREQDILKWFANELKQHRVIADIDDFLKSM